jgi:hypothetical protein
MGRTEHAAILGAGLARQHFGQRKTADARAELLKQLPAIHRQCPLRLPNPASVSGMPSHTASGFQSIQAELSFSGHGFTTHASWLSRA